MARWMSAIEGCRRTFLAVRPKGLEMVIDLSDTERLDEQTQDVLSLGDVHAMQRLYCVSKSKNHIILSQETSFVILT